MTDLKASGLKGAMPYTAKFEQWIPRTLPQVFEFFGNPENLPRIMPPWMRVSVDNATLLAPPDAPRGMTFAGEGSVAAVSFRPLPFLPFRVHSEAKIVRFAMNQFFEDTHSDRLFKSWLHRHEFAAEDRSGVSGTIVRDVINYELALGPLSPLANSLFVSDQMRRTFAYREQVVEQLLRSKPDSG